MADEAKRKRWRGPSLTTLLKQANRAGATVVSAVSQGDGRVELKFAPDSHAAVAGETPDDVKRLV